MAVYKKGKRWVADFYLGGVAADMFAEVLQRVNSLKPWNTMRNCGS